MDGRSGGEAELEAGRLELLGRLLPGALHELANPLLALGGTIDLLLDDAAPGSKHRERLELVQRLSHELAGLVRILQQLARERLEPESELELVAFTAETAGLARRLANVRDVRLDERFAGGGVRVRARPGVLRQALLALLVDALQAAEPGGRVEVVVDGTTVRISAGAAEGRPAMTAAAALGATLERLQGGGVSLSIARA